MTRKEFEKLWLRHFAFGISKSDMRKYVVATGNYIWHVFSWRLLPEGSYLEGDAARMAFDQIDKQGAIYVEAFGPGASQLTNVNCAADLDAFVEVYAAAPDFSWTYIKTHEITCGPYFCRKV